MADDIFDEVLNQDTGEQATQGQQQPTYYQAQQVPYQNTGRGMVMRAMAYGPSQGEYTRGTLNGPLGRLQQGDLAVSPDSQGTFPIGSYADVVNPRTGQVVLSNQRVADHSYIKPGVPTHGSFEVWNGQDMGHMMLVPKGSSGGPPSGSYQAGRQQQFQPWDERKGNPFAEPETFSPPSVIPPSWGEIQSADSYQQLDPEQRGKLADKWYSDAFNYAGSLGQFSPESRTKLYDFYQDARKQAAYVPPLDLGKTASDTISQGYGSFVQSVHKANAGAYDLESEQKSLRSDDTFRQAEDTIRNSPDLSDTQKQEGLQKLQESFQQKQETLKQKTQDELKSAEQAEKDYGLHDQFSKTGLGKNATMLGQMAAQLPPIVAGQIAGGPVLGALGGASSSGASGYEDDKQAARA